MRNHKSNIAFVPAMLTLALLVNHTFAFAQEGNRLVATTAVGSTENAANPDEVAVAADDINSLIDNLSGGTTPVVKIRVFSDGQVIDYPESMIGVKREIGVFDARIQTLLVAGTMNGIPMIEDFRFLQFGGKFYVLRDIHLNGTAADVVGGRSMPTTLEATAPTAAEARAPQSVARVNALVSKTALPTISAIHGYSDGPSTGISDGLADMSCGTTFNKYRVVNNIQPSAFYWDVVGTNFGTSKGAIQLAGIAVPPGQITWGPNEIRFYPAVPYYFAAASTALVVSTSNGTVTSALTIAPAISSRIFGQCTWLVALVRMNAGKPAPSSSFGPGGGWTSLTAAYIPQLWDALTYQWPGHNHTVIVIAVSAPVKSGNATTWTVTIEEANAACTNRITTKQSTFQVQNGLVIKAIQSDAKSGLAPGWYYR